MPSLASKRTLHMLLRASAIAFVSSALVAACAQISNRFERALFAEDDDVDETPSYWSDPATMADIDAGWENWPDWEAGTDLTPDADCAGGDDASDAIVLPPSGAGTLSSAARPASPQNAAQGSDIFWEVTVASWNILNFGTSKAYYNKDPNVPRTQLLDKIAEISAPYDIVFFQEILQDWNDVFPAAIATRLPEFTCALIGPELGWAGRKEYYAVCAKPDNATVESIMLGVASTANQCMGGGVCNYVEPATGQPTCPRKIWMRPPGVANVTIIPKDDPTPRIFTLIVNHLKPSYNRSYLPGGGKNPVTPNWYPAARPPGFPAPPAGAARWPLETAAVYYELQAINANAGVMPGASANTIILGDLNADCAYLPPYLKNAALPIGWNWLITDATNTGRVLAAGGTTEAGTACTYDRFILNAGAQQYDRGKEAVFRTGIANRLNGKQISDHYLIHMTLGEQRNKKRSAAGMLVAVADGVAEAAVKKRRTGQTKSLGLDGQGVSISPAPATPYFFVTQAAQGLVYAGSAHIPLHDVRPDGPTPVTIQPDGTLIAIYPTQHPLSWTIDDQTQGTFKFVLDANGDGYFDADENDLVNSPTGYDFLVYADQDVVLDAPIGEIGDNGRTRDFFSAGQADGVYTLSESVTLPSWSQGLVDVYIVSDKLLKQVYPWFTTWAEALGDEGIVLNNRGVTVPFRHVGPITDPTGLPAHEFVSQLQVASDGSLFFNAWDTIEDLMRTTVTVTNPPPPPATIPTEYDDDMIAIVGDGCATLTPGVTVDVTWNAFVAACKGANTFADYYGNAFNVVFDTNLNGVFDDTDMVDAADTSALAGWFQSHATLGPSSGASATVITQYQNILLSKLNYPSSIAITKGTYDTATAGMSIVQFCEAELTRDTFNERVVPEAQVGFVVLDETEYQIDRAHRRYVNMELSGVTYDGTDDGCLYAEETVYLNNITYVGAGQFTAGQGMVIAGTHSVSGNATVTNIVAPPPAPPEPLPAPPPAVMIEPGTSLLVTQSTIYAIGIAVLILL